MRNPFLIAAVGVVVFLGVTTGAGGAGSTGAARADAGTCVFTLAPDARFADEFAKIDAFIGARTNTRAVALARKTPESVRANRRT